MSQFISQCLWLITNLNIAQMCFIFENSQKWHIPDQYCWLICLSVCFVCSKSIHICFFMGSRMFVIYYKSKYSSDMFYDWKFSEMVYSGSVLMLYILFAQKASTYVFSWDPECLSFITNLNIAQTYFMIENSQKWFILDQHWWLVCFTVFWVC